MHVTFPTIGSGFVYYKVAHLRVCRHYWGRTPQYSEEVEDSQQVSRGERKKKTAIMTDDVAPAVIPKPKPKTAVKKSRSTDHPSYKEMIISTVGLLKERNGSSRQAILKHIKGHYNVGEGCETQVKLALKRLVDKKELIQVKGKGASGSFKNIKNKGASEAKPKRVVKKPVAKKPSTKASAKKPATPKKTTTKKTTAKKTPTKKPAAKKQSVKAKPAKKTDAKKKPAAKKASVKAGTRKAPAKKAATKKATPKKPASKAKTSKK